MAEIPRRLVHFYNYVFDEIADSRSKSYILGAKPYQGLTILAIYLIFVFMLGPKWMKNRKPYNLRKVLMVYNVIQVFMCAYIFIRGIHIAWGWKYKLLCEPVDESESATALSVLNLVYFYYLTKIADLLDTVFFVFRKKFKQITFLHVYHHTGMVMLIWGAFTYLPGGHGTLVGVINSFVHVVMYSYYFMTVYKPEVRNWLWLKKLVTQIQIVQFLLCVIHFIPIIFIPDCGYPRWTALLFMPQNLFILILFVDFYIKTYVRKSTICNKKHANNCQGINNYSDGINHAQLIVKSREAVTSDLNFRNVMRS